MANRSLLRLPAGLARLAGADRSARDIAPRVVALLAAVAFVLMAVFGVLWWTTATNDSLRYAQTRDEVLRVGQQGIVNFNTFDFRKPDDAFALWLDSSTGPLHDETATMRDQNKKLFEDTKRTTKAEVLDASVVELDDRAGKAKVMAAVQTVVTPDGGEPYVDRQRLQAELTRTDGGWKLSAIAKIDTGAV
ncbi:hypothetical protein [Goodfellowiella coeruleoviolacea]|uniref:Mce-associated membrane protein n=1 Tax=Goodfellowiella coeruleoviolacea TaxID=334858 RepID=A0AAE3GEH9_9PSEU|nr:hypothetical protein [Goodfellowiella coeruleoviolacea]MCP2165864.1 Mce-associated membrane protein [Goodfellowiella coeruleoviolacea]